MKTTNQKHLKIVEKQKEDFSVALNVLNIQVLEIFSQDFYPRKSWELVLIKLEFQHYPSAVISSSKRALSQPAPGWCTYGNYTNKNQFNFILR